MKSSPAILNKLLMVSSTVEKIVIVFKKRIQSITIVTYRASRNLKSIDSSFFLYFSLGLRMSNERYSSSNGSTV